VCYIFTAMGWQNIVCVVIGIPLVSLGIFGKNRQFRGFITHEPVPNWHGRLIAILTGTLFLAMGLLVRSWK